MVPPPEAQSAIVTFLDSENARIDTLVGEARQTIGLLKERRSARIAPTKTRKTNNTLYNTVNNVIQYTVNSIEEATNAAHICQ